VLSPQGQAQLMTPLSMPGPPATFPTDRASLADLRAAIRGQIRLEIAYEDGEGRRTRRVVWPLQLGFMDRARVLAAWCELRQDFRTFRTDRILIVNRRDPYPGRRADLVRRLRAHLGALSRREVS
jgi:predicted DNA-binding transcriptional regulator YafY